MKVKHVKSSSKSTKELIKKTFSELVQEKKELRKISVMELTKRAGISRATFYTHYDDIYMIAEEMQNDMLNLYFENANIKNEKDAIKVVDNVYNYLNQNYEYFKMVLSSDETMVFVNKLEKLCLQKVLELVREIKGDDKNSSIYITLMINGLISQCVNIFKDRSVFTLEEIFDFMKIWVKKILN